MSQEKAQNVLKDIGLCIQATKALQSKLEMLSASLEELFREIGTGTMPSRTTPIRPSPAQPVRPGTTVTPSRPSVAQPASRVTQPVQPRPRTTQSVPAVTARGTVISSKTGRKGITQLIEDFSLQFQQTAKGEEASKNLARLRDAIIMDAEVGHHPAFYEMAKWVTRLKRIGQIDQDTREDLLDQLSDWKRRLTREV
ncbi:MAG: hypothetical protein ACFFCQ_04775 [Promethearchaeota archaeon]